MTFPAELKRLSDAATQGEWSIALDRVLTKEGGGQGEPAQELVAGRNNIARLTIYSKLADGDLIALLANRRREILALVEAVDAAMRWQDENCEDAELFKEWLALTESMKSALANLDREGSNVPE